MEFSDVQKLMNQFEQSSTRELKIDDQDFHLYLSKNQEATPATQGQGSAPAAATATAAPHHLTTTNSSSKAVKAPLVGTVYLQPKPKEPAYVKVGDHVQEGDVVCVIEAMKMLTEVKSTCSGTVAAIKVENGDLVEFDQPLVMIKED